MAVRLGMMLGLLVAALAALTAPPAAAQVASPHAIDIPTWFTEGFLDFNEEITAAARSGKRLMVYFGQDGCPYCTELMQTNFTQRPIVDKTRKHFVAIALNLWGDRELTWIDGRKMSEKEFGRMLKVQFTPTLLFLDAQGRIATRLNGYYPPNRFSAALDYVIAGPPAGQPLGEYLAANVKEPAGASLNEQAFLMPPPFDLRRRAGGKPLAVIFETRHCQPCDEMHREGFKRAEMQALLRRFDVARFALSDPREVTTPAGRSLAARAWAHELQVAFTPTIVFFDDSGIEVFRIDGYLRPFHLATSFEYVASGGYRKEPEFQRYIRAKAERLRASGKKVELWN